MNDEKPLWVIDEVKLALEKLQKQTPSKCLSEISIVAISITFKADIDDLREVYSQLL